ncbi:M48 family metalloprotease [Agitococcus lubricus]|uniref:Zn-dependent protease with chaperone function n=1 Tax=Agitococcus lubricus TaxID=1077255 RepID=A0A2T5J0H4_9GAMM|nr:M48 family metalloprotease [Agitococcus lubricus]PTQ89850.1 Zn-dependent protease with chaperone function [Agitococcus lubricus]
MDFFSRQSAAKRASAHLVIYFIVAVAIIFLGVNAVLYIAAVLSTYDTGQGTVLWHAWSEQALLGALLLVVGGSAVEWFLLREGGQAIATLLGAKSLDFATASPLEQQFINVCEEMAIASGVPMPRLYVLPAQHTINAFVAGYSAQNSVLVLTQGALTQLSREELQAVVGHEYSHILNDDMRLNTYMVSLLAGLSAVGQMGEFLMCPPTTSHRQQRTYTPFWPLGWGLWLVGYVGLLLGRLIKAAISRERENLADASSVQFTRQPDALAGALYKIGQFGSYLHTWHAEQVSHMCFANSVKISQWLASHPPLEQRINTIAPSFLTRMKYQTRQTQTMQEAACVPSSQSSTHSHHLSFAPTTSYSPLPQSVDQRTINTQDKVVFHFDVPLSQAVGDLQWADLLSAQYLYRNLPIDISRALQTTTGAKMVLFALLAQEQQCSVSVLEDFFKQQIGMAFSVRRLQMQLTRSDHRLALPIVELAIPRLYQLPVQEQQQFLVELRSFAWLNQRLSVFEFALIKLIEQAIHPPKVIFRQQALSHFSPQCAQLVVVLLQHGAHPSTAYEQYYQQLLAPLFLDVPPMPTQCTLQTLDKVFLQFCYLNAEAKKQLINLAAQTIQTDGVLHRSEYELVRVLAAVLGCPMPLLQGGIKN